MSHDDADPLRRLQVAIDRLAGREDVPENVYLDACNALKELHSLSKLYKVTYYEFVAEEGIGDHGPVVSSRKRVRIMPCDDEKDEVGHWRYVLDHGSLPHDMTYLSPELNKPFVMDHHGPARGSREGIVTECVPYLKRQREGEEN